MANTSIAKHSVSTRRRCQLIDITSLVATAVADADIASGLAVVFVPHTTAAVTINENADPDVKHDLLKKLETLVPQREAFYQHSEMCFGITRTCAVVGFGLVASTRRDTGCGACHAN